MRPLLLFPGTLLVLLAILVPSGTLEAVLRRQPGELAWGPLLFRVTLAFHGLFLLYLSRRVVRRRFDNARPPLLEPWEWLSLSALTIVGSALRLYRLENGLWLDEILTVIDFVRLPFSGILTSFPSQNQHMLFSLLARASVELFGESAWAVRLPSVVFGVASIWALYFLGRKLIGARPAMLACLLMTLSYHHIWFSQNARGYMGLLLFTTLGTWLWLEALESDGWGWWIGYAVTCFLGAWIHMTMVFVAVTQFLLWIGWAAYHRRLHLDAMEKPLAAYLLAGTLTIQGHALALPEFFRVALHETSQQSEWTHPLWALREALRNLKIGFSGTAIVLAGAAFVSLGWFRILRRSPHAALAMVIPGLLGGGLMLAMGHNLWPRFFFFCMGFALLIVAEGAFVFPRRFATLAMLGIVAASTLTVPGAYYPKQDYAAARDFAVKQQTGGPIAAVGLASMVYQRYYISPWNYPQTPAELRSIVQQSGILVYSLPIELKAFHPELWQIVERDFETIGVFRGTLGGGEVFVSRPRQQSPGAHAASRPMLLIDNGGPSPR